ncbi:MAG: 16S rRNA (uracil(1498)-N(3))-methyltransferase [Clostridia bacterium]|nr:16S rRNA (uracil(1498)-N(3))-methyltransferase [Clostridia bacterium]
MPRFFIKGEGIEVDRLPETLFLRGEDAFHLSVSLRARVGDEVILCTENGLEILCTVSSLSGGKKNPEASLTPVSASESRSESSVSITLYQGMPKGKKTDSILQKCTELGVDRVVFVYSDRSIPTPSSEDNKLDRFTRICEEAAKQCGRGKLVKVTMLPSVELAVEEMKKDDLAFACWEEEGEKTLKMLLREGEYHTASFFIGPEGGLSEREVELFRRASIPTVTLGRRILRTETAASAVLSMFLYEIEL